ncbi:MAG TPA: Hsp20/alpha crystallin family protein [Ignavibacteriaceae bacterium]|nr:Hsp20/alpha crystallin family protein [Ignavibacteriaceae bacterium]
MTFVRFEPLRELDNLNNRLHKFFGEFPANIDLGFSFSPRIDVFADDKDFYLEAELPGLKKDEIKISLQDNILTLSGEKKKSDENDNKEYFRNERIFGTFSRSFTLPEDINPDSTEAKFEDGVLKISIAKTEVKSEKERNIKIK